MAFLDDEENMLRMFSRIYRKESFRLEVFSQATEFLSFLEGSKVDLLVSDLRMPHIDGLKLLNILDQRGSDFPIILLSGDLNLDQIELESLKNLKRILQKPIDGQHLKKVILELLKECKVEGNHI